MPVHVLPSPLRGYVAEAEGYAVGASPHGLHRGLPSRHLTLVVELAAPLRVGGLGSSVVAHGVVGGLHTRPALIDAGGPQRGLQYALTPEGARRLLGVPASDLRDQAVDLADLVGPGAQRLVDDLEAASTWTDRFRVLDRALLRRLHDVRSTTPDEVAEAWRMIFAADGRTRVSAVAAHVGWSRRHLAEQFRRATGITPKEAARVARFEAARRMLMDPRRPGLAEVAVHCGYADQPHLARDWLALAGCSVGTWLREELPFIQDSAVGERAESPA